MSSWAVSGGRSPRKARVQWWIEDFDLPWSGIWIGQGRLPDDRTFYMA